MKRVFSPIQVLNYPPPPSFHSTHTHIPLLYSDHKPIATLMNSSSSSSQWQNVTFGRNWPISSGTVSTDSRFKETESFKRQQKGTSLFSGYGWVGGWFACSSRMSNPWSFACSPFDNWSSIYSPVITGLVPAPCVSHLFLVSLVLVYFQLCSQLFTSARMIRNLFLVLQPVVYDWSQGHCRGFVALQLFSGWFY